MQAFFFFVYCAGFNPAFSFCIAPRTFLGSPVRSLSSHARFCSDTAAQSASRDTYGSNIRLSAAYLAGYQWVVSNPLSYCFLSFSIHYRDHFATIPYVPVSSP